MVMQHSRMEPVPVRRVWPHEEQVFTPWLAEHFDMLNDALDLNMEVIAQEEVIPGAGRADILARNGDTVAIIENQLDGSDDDHLVRMLHYAANRRAKLVVWVAHGFTDKHREIVGWLNDADGIDIYCVEVSAWRIGDSVAPMFRRVVRCPTTGLNPKHWPSELRTRRTGPITAHSLPACGTPVWFTWWNRAGRAMSVFGGSALRWTMCTMGWRMALRTASPRLSC